MTSVMPNSDARTTSPIADTEWALLDTLWSAGRITAREATERLETERGWAYSTVKTMLDRMVAKNLVRARQVGNVWEYEPAVDPETARRSAWRRFVGSVFGGAVNPALTFIARDARLTARQRNALRGLLEGQDPSDD